jgi:hypothetical protein
MAKTTDLSKSQPQSNSKMEVRVEARVKRSMKSIQLYIDCNGVTKESFGIIFHRKCFNCGDVQIIENSVKAYLKKHQTKFEELNGGNMWMLLSGGLQELSRKKKIKKNKLKLKSN